MGPADIERYFTHRAGLYASLLLTFIVGVTVQIVVLRREGRMLGYH